MPIRLLTNGEYMNGAMPSNTINKISVSRGIKKMTISQLEELCVNIQEFLNSQDVKMIETSEIGNVSIKLQEILNSCDVKKITSSELEQLKVKVQEILISHDMKFIKNSGIGDVGINYQGILNSHGLKKLSDTGVSKLRSEVKEAMWKYYSVNKLNLPDYIGEFREDIIIELMKGKDVEEVFDSVIGG